MIFVVEDEPEILEIVLYAMSSNGLDSKGFSHPSDFFAEIENLAIDEKPEMIILDVGLPDKSGIDIIKILKNKESTRHIPIILLTAKSGEMDKVRGLNSGADDYITKPFGILELIARIKALLRRTKQLDDKSHSFKEISVIPSKRLVVVDNSEIILTFKEFELLLMLIASPNLVFTREQLLDSIWGGEFQTRTVDVHINTLRTKLGRYGKYIQTVRGVGYKIGYKEVARELA